VVGGVFFLSNSIPVIPPLLHFTIAKKMVSWIFKNFRSLSLCLLQLKFNFSVPVQN